MSVVITYNQLAKLASQLPPADKRRLAKKLEQEAAQAETEPVNTSVESQLTPDQRKTWKNIKRGFAELKEIREGRLQAQSSDEYLDELRNDAAAGSILDDQATLRKKAPPSDGGAFLRINSTTTTFR